MEQIVYMNYTSANKRIANEKIAPLLQELGVRVMTPDLVMDGLEYESDMRRWDMASRLVMIIKECHALMTVNTWDGSYDIELITERCVAGAVGHPVFAVNTVDKKDSELMDAIQGCQARNIYDPPLYFRDWLKNKLEDKT